MLASPRSIANWDHFMVHPRRLLFGFGLLVVVWVLVGALPSAAVLIANGDGTGNTTVPVDRPALANVGSVGNFSGVYVRNGWVLTTDHVGVSPFVLDQVSYPPVPGSTVRFESAEGVPTELVAFKVATLPNLPDLLIADEALSIDELVMVMGNGRDRGVATSWNGLDGWQWLTGQTLRWGTNRVAFTNATIMDTEAFRVDFDPMETPMPGEFEADLVVGDSGGGAFTGPTTGSGPEERLVGILFARSTSPNQPAGTSLETNDGLIIDLHAYRDVLLDVIDQPGCSDGLDDDLDGLVDLDDPGCDGPDDMSERGASFECDNGIDDDGNGFTDFPDDLGCLDPTGMVEAPEPAFGLLVATASLGLAGLSRRRGHGRGQRQG